MTTSGRCHAGCDAIRSSTLEGRRAPGAIERLVPESGGKDDARAFRQVVCGLYGAHETSAAFRRPYSLQSPLMDAIEHDLLGR